MTVSWAATAPGSGRFEAPRTGNVADVLARIGELRAAGGYVEVSPDGHELPCLSLAFRGDRAVVQLLTGDATLLLVGDGSSEPDDTVEVPVLDDPDPAVFTGGFASHVDRGIQVLVGFCTGTAAEDLGDWETL